jgi:hypothetical protein
VRKHAFMEPRRAPPVSFLASASASHFALASRKHCVMKLFREGPSSLRAREMPSHVVSAAKLVPANIAKQARQHKIRMCNFLWDDGGNGIVPSILGHGMRTKMASIFPPGASIVAIEHERHGVVLLSLAL